MIIPDTSARSLIHKLLRVITGQDSPAPAKIRIYLTTAALLYLPLAIAALVGPKPPESHLQFFHYGRRHSFFLCRAQHWQH